MKIINLNCGICGTKTGEHTLDPKFGWTGKETPENLGYVDVRCDSCRAIHGEFKDMVEEYRMKIHDDPIEAENFIKVNRKKADFDAQMQVQIAAQIEALSIKENI